MHENVLWKISVFYADRSHISSRMEEFIKRPLVQCLKIYYYDITCKSVFESNFSKCPKLTQAFLHVFEDTSINLFTSERSSYSYCKINANTCK